MKIYNNKSVDSVIGKELEELGEIKVKLRADIDIVNPIIRLKAGFTDFNYCYIEELKRFYFVRGTSFVGNVVIIELKVDILESYKMEIKNINARVMRGVKTGDTYQGNIDMSVVKSITTHELDGVVELEDSIIISTVGV